MITPFKLLKLKTPGQLVNEEHYVTMCEQPKKKLKTVASTVGDCSAGLIDFKKDLAKSFAFDKFVAKGAQG